MNAQLSNAQLEILQLFSTDLTENEIEILRRMLIEFRYWRLQNAIDKLDISPETLESWSKEHFRTPYLSQQNKLEGV